MNVIRVMAWILVAIFGVCLVALGAVYGVSEWRLHRLYSTPLSSFGVDTAASAERGRRQVQLRGCMDCHGPHLQGLSMSLSALNSVVFPDIAGFARTATDAQVEHAIRHGIGPDGTGLYLMPSAAFYFIDDADLSDIIVYLRSIPPEPDRRRDTQFGLYVRWLIASGSLRSSAAGSYYMAARFLPDLANPEAEGAYLAHSICSECHGLDLQGGPGGDPVDATPPPDLAIVRAYSREAFGKLMQGAVALGGRKLGPLMTHVATDRTPHLTDQEIAALYAYLSRR